NRRSRFWNAVLPIKTFPTPLERFWQNLCGLRNYIWMKREYEGQSSISAAGTTAQFVLKHLLYDDRPLKRIPWILRFARDGRRGRAGCPPGCESTTCGSCATAAARRASTTGCAGHSNRGPIGSG